MYSLEAINIGKIYKIYNAPSYRLKEIIFKKRLHKEFHALRSCTFSLEPGNTLGIIGDNGAGKSTLLKILAGTLSPSYGEVRKNGRVSALLELGAGFHPEFTGRQNIYINGTLLGLTESELREKEKEIIAFSGINDFIDQPVKTYSSGMYVRLAFAIATTVDPDILIVDEALSVGDQRFQQKCIERMEDFRKENRTIIFCSHSMYHVVHLCNKAIWLNNGTIRMSGDAKSVVQGYEDWCRERTEKERQTDNKGDNSQFDVNFSGKIAVSLENGKQHGNDLAYKRGDTIRVKIDYEAPSDKCHIAIGIKRNDGIIFFATSTQLDGIHSLKKSGSVSFILPSVPLLSGTFFIDIALLDKTGNIVFNRASIPMTIIKDHEEIGAVYLPHKWEI